MFPETESKTKFEKICGKIVLVEYPKNGNTSSFTKGEIEQSDGTRIPFIGFPENARIGGVYRFTGYWKNDKFGERRFWVKNRSDELLKSAETSIIRYLTQTAEYLDAHCEHDGEDSKSSAWRSIARGLKGLEEANSIGALRAYIDGRTEPRKDAYGEPLIFPFGSNLSQMKAVENAFTSQFSVIQGPPGTGKTQTILNIIANLLIREMSVAVVSNNNSATKNVQEKLTKEGLGWLVAELGSDANQQAFFANQPKVCLKEEWHRTKPSIARLNELRERVKEHHESDTLLHEKQHALWLLQSELEVFLDETWAKGNVRETDWYRALQQLTEERAVAKVKRRIEGFLGAESWYKRLWHGIGLVLGRRLPWAMMKRLAAEGDTVLSVLYVLLAEAKAKRLEREIVALAAKVEASKDVAETFRKMSRDYFLAMIFERFDGKTWGNFERDSFKNKNLCFLARFPIVTSSTFSLHRSTPYEKFDFVIIDEASQSNIPTSALCYAQARNAVVVGDLKQLDKIIDEKTPQPGPGISAAYNVPQKSILQSVTEVFGQRIPSVLLREHYRCNRAIIEFCNRRFYDGQLVIMTPPPVPGKDKEALVWIETVHNGNQWSAINGSPYNERQLLVAQDIQREYADSPDSDRIGFISPYKGQVQEMQKLGLSADTVHKYQGKEKDIIVYCTVKGKENAFNAQPSLVNVAVSRAKDKLILISPNYDGQEDGNISALIRYIRQSSKELRGVRQAKYRSVFDALFDRSKEVEGRKGKESPAETLFRKALEELKKDLPEGQTLSWDFTQEYSLSALVRKTEAKEELYTPAERQYMHNEKTCLDFLIYDRMDREPLAAIEVDGEAFHKPGSVQAQRDAKKNSILRKIGLDFIRLRTRSAEGNEMEKVKALLQRVLEKRNHTMK